MIGRIEYEVLKRLGVSHKSIYPLGYRYENIPEDLRYDLDMARDIVIYYAIKHKVLSDAEIGDRLGYSRSFANRRIRKLSVAVKNSKDLQSVIHDLDMVIAYIEGIYLPVSISVKVRPYKGSGHYRVYDPSTSDKTIVVKAKDEQEAIRVYRETIRDYDTPKPVVSPYVLPGIKTQEITVSLIVSVVSRYMGVAAQCILGHSRVQPIVKARHILRYVIYDMCHMAAPDIALEVHADRTSVIRSLQVVAAWMRYDVAIRQDINNIKKTINILT